ncbi:outer membrane beta-barrel protein [Pedobacter nutrimenti]|jgi:outer membrane protein|uniref:Outer membrane protein with beta-barrel domain n=1 Tax=Pedobacter nutrimenti TaxID=1241337 RepID=A0A318UKT8_9SPHI|nr:outer membrane beta-barrel protein [Pedobacter nutrimenti]PYF68968.1 outer membrane protein with beta-barrel domain [Pedobacter nutrimenti]|eukprot:gene9403-11010_t
MKKLLLSIVAVAALAFSTQAQTEKGKIMLGGNVGFNSTKVSGAAKSDVSFSVVPSIGYFVSNNFAIGTGVGYTYDKAVSDKKLTQAFQVAPFGRYYVALSEQFKFFGQLAVPMEFGTAKLVDANGNTGAKLGTTTNIGVTVAPGFAFYPTKHIGIEVSVNGLEYAHNQFKAEGTGAKATSNSFGLDANTFAPKLGVMFHF